MNVAVVGGSLGGLITACLLSDDGHNVVVYERSPKELEERGAGIGLLPETARYLVERAGHQLSDIAISTKQIRYLARDGSIAHEDKHEYHLSSWNTVYREMFACFDHSRYRLSHELDHVELDPLQLHFTNGVSISPDLAVFADGVGSAARTQLLPNVATKYSGYVAWRGVVPEKELSDATRLALDDALTYYVYANSHILVYPIPGRDGSVVPGERLINVVWYRNYQAGEDLESLLLDRNGVARDVSVPPGALRDEHISEARAVAAARLPDSISEVVLAIDQLFIQVVFDLEVPQMVFGNACLLGDAAFVARPHAAAGTAKAAEDAWTLRNALAAHQNDIRSALSVWEPTQLALGRSLLARTRAIGRRSQFDGTWIPGDPEFLFGLHGPNR